MFTKLFNDSSSDAIYASANIIYRKGKTKLYLFPLPTCCQAMILKTNNRKLFLDEQETADVVNRIAGCMREESSFNPRTVFMDRRDRKLKSLYNLLKETKSNINFLLL